MDAVKDFLKHSHIKHGYKIDAVIAAAKRGSLRIVKLLFANIQSTVDPSILLEYRYQIDVIYAALCKKSLCIIRAIGIIRAILEIPEGSNQIPDHILKSPQNPTGWLTTQELINFYWVAFHMRFPLFLNLIRPYIPEDMLLLSKPPEVIEY